MKRILYFAVVLLLALAACKKDPVKVSVTGISLSPTFITLAPGESKMLSATLAPSGASNKSVSWTTDNASVATVSGGEVKAVGIGSATITATSADGGFTATCAVTVSKTPVTAIDLSKTSLTLDINETVTITATLTPSDATDKTISWSVAPKDVVTFVGEGGGLSREFKAVAEGSAVITAYALGGSSLVKAECNVTVKKAIPAGAVDLGLKVYWAECNLGASSPEGYGDYYAWGEIEAKTDYSWGSYKWCNGASNKLTKYCPANMKTYWDGVGTPDGKSELDPEDDAAHAVLKGNWHIPTQEEWQELGKCEWTWTTQNGVNGVRVKGKNGNSIFLPASGFRKDSSSPQYVGTVGYYWSSSLRDGVPNMAWNWYLKEGLFSSNNGDRCNGYPVRGVYPATD